ncbi:MAG TPA: hypothetical protein VIZ22_10320 [Candidatus Limnocylindrales bacterium]
MGIDNPAAWGEFGVALVGASAALAGLTFVAISINLREILAGPGLTGRAGEAVTTLLLALVTCALLLVPDQGTVALGLEWVVLGIGFGTILLRTHIRAARTLTIERSLLAGRIALHQSAAILWLVAGIATVNGLPGGLYWVAPAALWTIAVGITDAWVLLIEILR